MTALLSKPPAAAPQTAPQQQQAPDQQRALLPQPILALASAPRSGASDDSLLAELQARPQPQPSHAASELIQAASLQMPMPRPPSHPLPTFLARLLHISTAQAPMQVAATPPPPHWSGRQLPSPWRPRQPARGPSEGTRASLRPRPRPCKPPAQRRLPMPILLSASVAGRLSCTSGRRPPSAVQLPPQPCASRRRSLPRPVLIGSRIASLIPLQAKMRAGVPAQQRAAQTSTPQRTPSLQWLNQASVSRFSPLWHQISNPHFCMQASYSHTRQNCLLSLRVHSASYSNCLSGCLVMHH